jgi:hypothetical protein
LALVGLTISSSSSSSIIKKDDEEDEEEEDDEEDDDDEKLLLLTPHIFISSLSSFSFSSSLLFSCDIYNII